MSHLGRLKPVDLRSQWPHAAHNFTRWLAKEPNLVLMGEALRTEPTATEG